MLFASAVERLTLHSIAHANIEPQFEEPKLLTAP